MSFCTKKVFLTKQKQNANNTKTFPCYLIVTKQVKNKKEIDKHGKIKVSKSKSKDCRKCSRRLQKIEEGVVGGYKKIEEGAVDGFNKIADKFVDNYLTREGESVEEARARFAGEQKAREEASKVEREERSARQKAIVEKNMQKAQNVSLEARRKAGL